MDGVTVGHPRCNISQCTNRLLSPRDRFCQVHLDLQHVCAADGCSAPSSKGFRTCDHQDHRQLELERREAAKAIFRLKARLERAAGPTVDTTHSEEEVDLIDQIYPESDAFLVDASTKAEAPAAKQRSKKPSIRSALTRRWTHNEQLMFRPCGIIISRATCFEAESVSNAKARTYLDSTAAPVHQAHEAIRHSSLSRSLRISQEQCQATYSTTITVSCFVISLLVASSAWMMLDSSSTYFTQSTSTRIPTLSVSCTATRQDSQSCTTRTTSGYSTPLLQSRGMFGLVNSKPLRERWMSSITTSFLTK